MGRDWLNIRFGSYHVHIGRDGISGGFNPYHAKGSEARQLPGWKWFKVHQFFGRPKV